MGLGDGIWATRHAPRDAKTLREKDAAARENFKDEAMQERPILKK